MKVKIYLIAILFYLVPVIGCAQQTDIPNMSVEDLHSQMQTDSTLVILDVRTEAELTGELGHIDGVVNIPVQVLSKRIGELEKYKERPIAVICRSGNRSVVATKMLEENGFNVKNVVGGMRAWNAKYK